MISNARALLFAILAASLSLAQAAGEALPEQLQQIESLQRRADKLAFGELGANNYHLAKARSWLDLALGEYHENEGTGIVPSAIEQAESLLDALEKKQTGISMDTPQQLPGSETVRPDLWNKIAALKKNRQVFLRATPHRRSRDSTGVGRTRKTRVWLGACAILRAQRRRSDL